MEKVGEKMILNRMNFKKEVKKLVLKVNENSEYKMERSVNKRYKMQDSKGNSIIFDLSYDFEQEMFDFFVITKETIGESRELVRFLLKEIKQFLIQNNWDCFLLNNVAEFLEEEYIEKGGFNRNIVPVGAKAKKLFRLLKKIPCLEHYEYDPKFFWKYQEYDNYEYRIILRLKEGRICFVLADGRDCVTDEYLMYECKTLEEYLEIEKNVLEKKRQREELEEKIKAFLIEKNDLNLFNNIVIEKEYREDEEKYHVYTFTDHKEFDSIDDIFSYLKEDYGRFEELRETRKELIKQIIQKDHYSFVMTKDYQNYDAFNVYIGSKESVYGIEVKYYVFMDHYELKMREHQLKFKNLSLLKEHFIEIVTKSILKNRLEGLVTNSQTKYIPRISYEFCGQCFVNIETSLTKEEINGELSLFYNKNKLKEKKCDFRFEKIGKLLIYKEIGRLFIEKDPGKFLDKFQENILLK